MEQQFSLSWREFQGNLTSGCAHLLASGEFADVTLAMEGQLLKAHRLVLSICSPFFQRMFHANPCHHPIVVLKDISYNAMKDLLQFMYNGEVSVKQEDLTNLISTAETLEIKGLTNKLNNNQENNNEISNDFTQKPSNFIFNANNKDRVPDKVVYQNDEQQLELLNQLSKFASFKRKCDSLMSKTYDSENCIQPEKRTKLREKQILNRHKIVNSHKTLLPNKFSNKYRSELLTSEPIVQNQLPDKYFDDSANISNHQEVKSNGTAESHSNVECDVKRESEEAESDCALDEPTPRINDLTNDASMDNGVEDLSTLPNNEQGATPHVAAQPETALPTRYRYIYSRKGHKQLVHMNFVYTKHSTSNGKTSWRCVQYFSLNRCPATAETFGSTIYAINHLHNHEHCLDKIVNNSVYEMEETDP